LTSPTSAIEYLHNLRERENIMSRFNVRVVSEGTNITYGMYLLEAETKRDAMKQAIEAIRKIRNLPKDAALIATANLAEKSVK